MHAGVSWDGEGESGRKARRKPPFVSRPEVSIPRKLYNEWGPTIKIKINNYECNDLCDLGAGVSTIPKSLCDVLGLHVLDECSLNFALSGFQY